MTKKAITLGALEIMSVDGGMSGWRGNPRRAREYGTLAYWQEVARVLDAGNFDFLFFADATGYPMDPDGIPDEVLRYAVQTPVHDPITIISGLAATVDRLNFGVTASTTVENPFMHARRFASLDHLTNGRIGWNIVNSDNQTALVKLLGLGDVMAHGRRYDRAEEFVELCLELWEGSWQDDAVVLDLGNSTYADPRRVRTIEHHGEFFDLEGNFTVTPSLQRTPMLFQAGSSERGRDFGARYAEGIYIGEHEVAAAREVVSFIRERARAHGRDGGDVKILNSCAFFVGETEAEAREKYEAHRMSASDESLAMLFLGWSGINLLRLPPDAPLAEATTEFGQGVLAKQDDGRTVGEMIAGLRDTLLGMRMYGTPTQLADEIEHWLDDADVDGFLVEATADGAQSYREFTELVVPELERRGRMKPVGAPTSFRDRMSGSGHRVKPSHPAAAYRR